MDTVILIGAGRSGSSLLMNMLNAHPRIGFYGETDFLVPRLWNQLWENRFWFHWKLQSDSNATREGGHQDGESRINLRGEYGLDIPEPVISNAKLQVAQIIQDTVLGLFKVDRQNLAVWGYKELWNGSGSHLYSWDAYDLVFPEARWLHLVRNPFTYAQSVSQWRRTALDFNSLPHILKQWAMVVSYSRRRKSTGRFFEIRYEDLITSPRETLSDLLQSSNLQWDDGIERPLKTRVMRSIPGPADLKNRDLTPKDIKMLFQQIPEIEALCEELRYTDNPGMENYFRSYSDDLTPSRWVMPKVNLAEPNWEKEVYDLRHILKQYEDQNSFIKSIVKSHKNPKIRIVSSPFTRDGENSWSIRLPDLASISDREDCPDRSNLLLLENDRLLGPGHSLHTDIRAFGGGVYSHWKENLYFSTSDNSDPNLNKRKYTILYVV